MAAKTAVWIPFSPASVQVFALPFFRLLGEGYDGLEVRQLELKGKSQPIEVYVLCDYA